MVPLFDLLTFAAVIVGLAVMLTVGGLALLRSLRGWSITVLLVVVAVVTVAGPQPGGGGAATVLTMFFSLTDRGVVVLLIAVGGLVGLSVALLLGRSVMASIRALRDAVRAVAGSPTSGAGFRPPDVALPAELAELSRELESAHLRLEAARARERTLETSHRELVAWVSHDLRTPLAGLRATAEALEEGVAGDSDTAHQYYGRMRREVDRLTEMVDDLFELARMHTDALQPAAADDPAEHGLPERAGPRGGLRSTGSR